MDSAPARDYAGDETHYLLAARSLAEQRNLDVADDYRTGAYREFDSAPPRPQRIVRSGARYEPHWIGLPLLAAPFYALGGAKAVECLIAVVLAAAMACGYLLARRVVPDPWCSAATVALGISPPLIAAATTIQPEPVAAAALAGAAALAARLGRTPSRGAAFACFVLLGTLPWLGIAFVPPGLVVGWTAVRALRRSGRGLLALGSTEVAFFSVALLVGLNESLFGGPTPHAADVPGTSATGADSLSDYLGRCWRLAALFLDRHYGLLRWSPVAALLFAGAWLLYRAGRERLVRAISGLGEEHAVARAGAVAALATAVVAALFMRAPADGGFPTVALVPALPLLTPLIALGFRQAPRLGSLLAIAGLAGSVWLWVDTRSGGGLFSERPPAPWGPLLQLFPEFHGGAWPYVLLAAVAAALAVPVLRKEIELRRRLG